MRKVLRCLVAVHLKAILTRIGASVGDVGLWLWWLEIELVRSEKANANHQLGRP